MLVREFPASLAEPLAAAVSRRPPDPTARMLGTLPQQRLSLGCGLCVAAGDVLPNFEQRTDDIGILTPCTAVDSTAIYARLRR